MLHDKARSAGFVLPPWMAGARVEALTKNEASMSRLSDGGHAGLSRPSMASEALGLLPGEMQEHFPAVPGWRDKLKAKEHFSALPGWRDKKLLPPIVFALAPARRYVVRPEPRHCCI
ncbi:MAG TPA: hypothetical protein VFL07_00895 [Rudaea sp.]|nr:hypothetical protein [Rudaea sp.]